MLELKPSIEKTSDGRVVQVGAASLPRQVLLYLDDIRKMQAPLDPIPWTPGEMFSGVGKDSVYDTLMKLEKRGWVQRIRERKGGRYIVVTLAGQRAAEEMRYGVR